MIESCVRGWLGRLKVRRLRWKLLMLARRTIAATTVQACFRRYLARCKYHRLCDARFLFLQAQRRLEVLRQKSARIMQGAWLIYRARCRVMSIKEALLRERALAARRQRAATEIQRAVRGLLARRLYARLQVWHTLTPTSTRALTQECHICGRTTEQIRLDCCRIYQRPSRGVSCRGRLVEFPSRFQGCT